MYRALLGPQKSESESNEQKKNSDSISSDIDFDQLNKGGEGLDNDGDLRSTAVQTYGGDHVGSNTLMGNEYNPKKKKMTHYNDKWASKSRKKRKKSNQ